jgi:hypothetical protein
MKNLATKLAERVLLGFFSASVIMLGSAGVSMAEEQLARMSGDSDIYLDMTTKHAYGSVVVQVVGPEGYTYEQEFIEGPYIPGPLNDGLYKYEMYLVPGKTTTMSTKGFSATVSNNIDENGRVRYLAKSKAALPLPYQRRGYVQSGTFRIENGFLVAPEIEEN